MHCECSKDALGCSRDEFWMHCECYVDALGCIRDEFMMHCGYIWGDVLRNALWMRYVCIGDALGMYWMHLGCVGTH